MVYPCRTDSDHKDERGISKGLTATKKENLLRFFSSLGNLKQSPLPARDFLDNSFDVAFIRRFARLDDFTFLHIAQFTPRLFEFGVLVDEVNCLAGRHHDEYSIKNQEGYLERKTLSWLKPHDREKGSVVILIKRWINKDYEVLKNPEN